MGEDLLKRFESANTLTDVYMIARQLKAEGVDSLTVNDLVSKAKKALVSKSSGVRRIKRIPVTQDEVPTIPITQFFIEIEHLNRPLISIEESGRIVI